MEDIQGMHYDNLSLDQMMFDAIMYQIETGKQPIQLKRSGYRRELLYYEADFCKRRGRAGMPFYSHLA